MRIGKKSVNFRSLLDGKVSLGKGFYLFGRRILFIVIYFRDVFGCKVNIFYYV